MLNDPTSPHGGFLGAPSRAGHPVTPHRTSYAAAVIGSSFPNAASSAASPSTYTADAAASSAYPNMHRERARVPHTPRQGVLEAPVVLSPITPATTAGTGVDVPSWTLPLSHRADASDARATFAAQALQHVLTEHRVALEALDARDAPLDSYARLEAAVANARVLATRSKRAASCLNKVQLCLRAWVTHHPVNLPGGWTPAHLDVQASQAAAVRRGADIKVLLKEALDDHAEKRKREKKRVLDARRDALRGLFTPFHFEKLKNQITAELSAFKKRERAAMLEAHWEWVLSFQEQYYAVLLQGPALQGAE